MIDCTISPKVNYGRRVGKRLAAKIR